MRPGNEPRISTSEFADAIGSKQQSNAALREICLVMAFILEVGDGFVSGPTSNRRVALDRKRPHGVPECHCMIQLRAGKRGLLALPPPWPQAR